MSRFGLLLAPIAMILAVPLLAVEARAAESPPRLSIAVDRTEITTRLGDTVAFRSTIANDGPATVSGAIAHLNVLSLRDGVYVDPEDWSSQRTRYLSPLRAGASTSITWHVRAVSGGVIGIYVAVLPEIGAGIPPPASPLIRLDVADTRTLNAGGIVPLALGIPALIGVLTLGVRLRRRWTLRA